MKAILILILFMFAACGGVTGSHSYKDRAEEAYRNGKELLEDGNYLEALTSFNRVKNEFPYSPFAALSALAVGEVYFEEEKYVESIDVFRLFVRSYPEHPEVSTALFKESSAFYEQRPSEASIFPPSFERDKGPTKDTITALDRFLTRYPRDKRVKEAKEMRRACRASLAEYELYVAGFYLDRDKPWSARQRLETVVQTFPDTAEQWRRAAVALVDTYLLLAKVNETDIEPVANGEALAKALAKKLAKRFPRSVEAKLPVIIKLQ
jgi:outer membrane protein assembly factor BamD